MDEALVWPFLIGGDGDQGAININIYSRARNISSLALTLRRLLNSSLKSSRSSSRSMCRRISPIFSLLLPSFHRIPGACINMLCIVLLRKPDLEGSVLPVNVC
jgi:hypothetical protein